MADITPQSDIQRDLSHLRAQVDDLRADMAQMTRTLRRFNGGAGPESEVRSAVERRMEELRDTLRGVRQRGQDSVADMRKEIEKYPLASMAAALGVGLALGWLSRLGGRH